MKWADRQKRILSFTDRISNENSGSSNELSSPICVCVFVYASQSPVQPLYKGKPKCGSQNWRVTLKLRKVQLAHCGKEES